MPQLLRLSWTASLVAAVTQVFLSATPASAMNLTLAQAYQGATFFDGFVYNVCFCSTGMSEKARGGRVDRWAN